MPYYLVNKQAQPTGEREVHETTCSYLPHPPNRDNLGWHSNCASAVAVARRRYHNVDGCRWCSPACHTR